ncbi:uncharacterized protein BO97DRAFT_55527 [Aspergillus homomorphus CBS 101889]|uniref:Uncharacterized protein n=1 Tax=Aspergillus homomorphus (strain CBS 101889) TaxID=1450537 RepID=A0A395HZ35_ASPHC|nr:hypothetical protein BO97DRAFT_55527 [Aspergillus homomorphus CBS 101889]RAL12796.1 hypothetical protein BO97DRAFT_55527 [Aspergillus homomorphus CBS 101889]
MLSKKFVHNKDFRIRGIVPGRESKASKNKPFVWPCATCTLLLSLLQDLPRLARPAHQQRCHCHRLLQWPHSLLSRMAIVFILKVLSFLVVADPVSVCHSVY